MDISVFEVSNEVAHKVGGIYAVIASKAPLMRKSFTDYYAIGPYDPKSVSVDFEEIEDHPFRQEFLELAENENIKCVLGRWNRADNVKCILVDSVGPREQLNEIKTALWDDYAVDSLYSNGLFDESVAWGTAVGIVLDKLFKSSEFTKKQIICQFHEWLTGAALLYLHKSRVDAGLVFTTHATTMGRTIAERGEDLVGEISSARRDGLSVDLSRAKVYGVEAIHTLECACAHNADVFTTVSKVTAEEAEYVLGRKADVLTLNGLDINSYPSTEELSIYHRRYKRRIKHFIQAFFSPYYPIDTKNCLYFFTAGRYEYHNKGFDILIDALSRLNEKLKKDGSRKTAIVFLWIPTGTRGGDLDVLANLSLFEAMESEIDGNLESIRERIIDSICVGKLPTKSKIFDKSFIYNLKQIMSKMGGKKGPSAPICALDLADEHDIILSKLKEKGLDNKADDRVKIIYYPTYLSSADGLLGLNYNEAIMGTHLGLFPSYYEPWGYTPLETAALAVPALTTDLAGFGRFIKEHSFGKNPAIKVVDRFSKGDEKAINQTQEYMHFILNTARKDRVKKKMEAKKLSELADWNKLIENYIQAYVLAIKNKDQRKTKT